MSSKITLYENKNLTGLKLEVTSKISTLFDKGFNDIVSCVVVDEGAWVLFEHVGFEGEIYVVMEGETVNLETVGWSNVCSSLKPIEDYHWINPSCTIYEHNRFGGKSLTLTGHDVKDLRAYGYNDNISSVKVYSGAWVAYEHAGYKGRQSLFLKGDHLFSASEGGFRNDSISSLRGIKKKPKAKIEVVAMDYDLESGILDSKLMTVFSWSQYNNTDVEQTLSVSQEQCVTKENTYEFRWDQGTSMTASCEVTVGLPGAGSSATLGLSVESTHNVGTTSGKQVSKSDQWTINFPSVIPPKSSVFLKSTVSKGKMKVPFTAVLRQGDEKWTEKGTFCGVNYYNFNTTFKKEKL